MSSIAITLPDERLQKLREIAQRFRVPPEELVRVSIEELVTRSDEEFEQALDYIPHKNEALYRRLA